MGSRTRFRSRGAGPSPSPGRAPGFGGVRGRRRRRVARLHRTPFRLVVQRAGSVLRISVADDSAHPPVLRPFDPRARRGRGLQVIVGVARGWGCDEHEGGRSSGWSSTS